MFSIYGKVTSGSMVGSGPFIAKNLDGSKMEFESQIEAEEIRDRLNEASRANESMFASSKIYWVEGPGIESGYRW